MDDRASPRPRSNSAVRSYPCSLFARIICIGSQSKLNSKESCRERRSTPRICAWTHYLRRSLLWILTQAIACARTLMFSTKVDTLVVSADRLRRVSPVSGRPSAHRPGRATRDERRLHLRIRLSMLQRGCLREGISIKDPLFGISKLKRADTLSAPNHVGIAMRSSVIRLTVGLG